MTQLRISYSATDDGRSPPAGCTLTRPGPNAPETRVAVSSPDYSVEIFLDGDGDAWVQVRTPAHTSLPIPFADFVIANQ